MLLPQPRPDISHRSGFPEAELLHKCVYFKYCVWDKVEFLFTYYPRFLRFRRQTLPVLKGPLFPGPLTDDEAAQVEQLIAQLQALLPADSQAATASTAPVAN